MAELPLRFRASSVCLWQSVSCAGPDLSDAADEALLPFRGPNLLRWELRRDPALW